MRSGPSVAEIETDAEDRESGEEDGENEEFEKGFDHFPKIPFGRGNNPLIRRWIWIEGPLRKEGRLDAQAASNPTRCG